MRSKKWLFRLVLRALLMEMTFHRMKAWHREASHCPKTPGRPELLEMLELGCLRVFPGAEVPRSASLGVAVSWGVTHIL